ncbi:metallophosphoesterase family protein [Aquimarina sp. 2201CG1-2-11]|uniref:metallophosphoesterase family protein n=1 Tax=Aquimarina discodermiae TaxID=3231043 RepID=UPI003463658C
MGRKLVVGDIHGGLKALEQVLEKVKITRDDTLIFLGDYVDGWSDSAQVISLLIELKTSYNCIFIRGNHDDLCYTWLTQEAFYPEWVKHGGQATMNSYEKIADNHIKEHLLFYENLFDYHIDSDNRLFVHAGFTSLHGPHKEYFNKLCYWDRTLWETALALDPKLEETDDKYPKRLLLFDEIYIGHTPVTRINKTIPVHATGVWNIDTGAAFKGPLTIMDVETKEWWQSDPVYKLYPNEKGRN